MRKKRCECVEPDGFYLDVWGEECCKRCGNAMPDEASILRAKLDAVTKERDELRKVFRWLHGLEGEFPIRQPGQGAYYWRTPLRKRLDAINPTILETEDSGEGR